MDKKDEVISNLIKKSQPKRNTLRNIIKAFFVGGFICFLAEVIREILSNFISDDLSINLSTCIMIIIGVILTGIGLYDRIGQFSGAGTIIPITGFANSVSSSAIEYKSEGIVTGIINNIFKLAGSVIVTGVISAFFVSILIYLLGI